MILSRRIPGKSLAGWLVILAASTSLHGAPPSAGTARISDGNRITRTSLSTAPAPAEAAPANTAPAAPASADGALCDGSEIYPPPAAPCGAYGAGRMYYKARCGNPALGYTYYSRTPRLCRGPIDCWLGSEALRFRATNQCVTYNTAARVRCALSPLAPLTYWDVGARCDVTALNPGYVDPRGQQTFAAQGYGVPIAVPLAPVVRDQYNYGWGLPSSRLEPVSYPPIR
jgi:hypothetical protein